MVNIYVVRHGEYENNVSKKLNINYVNEKHLTSKGIDQARRVREELKNINFDRVIVSQFTRTSETAREISNLEFEVRDEINEINIGEDDMSYESHDQRARNQIFNNQINENDEDLRERIEILKEFLEELKNEKSENILLVTHKDIMRIFKLIIENLDITEFYNINFENCEIYKI